MAGVNKAIIVGRLGKNPDLKYTQEGKPVVTMSVATSDKYNGQEQTEWHRVVGFGRLAEICGEYLSKGQQAYFEGKIQTRKWADRDGIERYTTEIIAFQMQMLGERQNKQQAEPAQDYESSAGSYDDNNIPF